MATPVGEVDPAEAYEALAASRDAALVDCRSHAEWTFTGIPDLRAAPRDVALVEWAAYPAMTPDPRFADRVAEALGPEPPARIFFLCRSGQRSLLAARTVAAAFAERGLVVECLNVAEGFEGPVDGEGHRGTVAGWKARGLPWRQG